MGDQSVPGGLLALSCVESAGIYIPEFVCITPPGTLEQRSGGRAWRSLGSRPLFCSQWRLPRLSAERRWRGRGTGGEAGEREHGEVFGGQTRGSKPQPRRGAASGFQQAEALGTFCVHREGFLTDATCDGHRGTRLSRCSAVWTLCPFAPLLSAAGHGVVERRNGCSWAPQAGGRGSPEPPALLCPEVPASNPEGLRLSLTGNTRDWF